MSRRLLRHVCWISLTIARTSFGAAEQQAPDITAAIAQTRQDITIAAAELERVRDMISGERSKLAARVQFREAEVRKLRGEVVTLERSWQEDAVSIETLRGRVRRMRDDSRFVETMIAEYRRGLETRVPCGLAEEVRQKLAVIEANMPDITSDPAGIAPFASAITQFGLALQKQRLGPLRINGDAVDENGNVLPGTFVTLGPIALFAGRTDSATGVAVARPGSLAPGLYTAISVTGRDGIRTLVDRGEGIVPIDVTPNGDAMKAPHEAYDFLRELLDGGIVMIPLVGVGVTAILIALWKLVELAGLCTHDEAAIRALLSHLENGAEGAANAVANAVPAPLGGILRDGITYRRASREHLEEILHEHIAAYLPRLERHLGILAVLGGIAPLLGLLGTVTGMIHTFQLVTIFGTGEARVLSGGISEALITTKFGLVIAIPILLGHALLARRVRTLAGHLEGSAVMFVNRLKHADAADDE